MVRDKEGTKNEAERDNLKGLTETDEEAKWKENIRRGHARQLPSEVSNTFM